jgi:hypothetical protein
MIYMSPQSKAQLPSQKWGHIVTPIGWSGSVQKGRPWCLDNGVFTGKFTPDSFWKKLEQMQPFRSSCVFVVAPDVVGDAVATIDNFCYWGPQIKERGWPVAFVAQDGQELFEFPPDFDALFIGGSTDWKMSQHALGCIAEARQLGKWVHVGRVNSQKRIRHFQLAGVDSVDGTSICFAPNQVYALLDRQLHQPPLFIHQQS